MEIDVSRPAQARPENRQNCADINVILYLYRVTCVTLNGNQPFLA